MPDGSAASLMTLPRSPGRRIIRSADAQNWIDGYRFVEEARRSADSLKQSARKAYEEAKARGFEEGRTAGCAEAAAIVADTSAKVDRYLASLEAQLAELSLSIVEQVIGRFDDAELVARAAGHALAAFRREKHVKIRVSPEHVEAVQQALAASDHADMLRPTIIVEADSRLGARECTIVTDFAIVNASIDAQLDIIRRVATASGGDDA
jgi:type III secretion protein L